MINMKLFKKVKAIVADHDFDIMFILSIVLFFYGLLCFGFHIGDPGMVPGWYPHIVDVRLVGMVVGLLGAVMSGMPMIYRG